MTMPVLTLLTPAAAPQMQIGGQQALTDYSEGQQQSYSDDLAALLAAMETALVQLDSEIQQLSTDTGSQPEPQELVQSMLPQPLLFDPLIAEDTTAAVAELLVFTETPPALTEGLAAEPTGMAAVVMQHTGQAAAASFPSALPVPASAGIATAAASDTAARLPLQAARLDIQLEPLVAAGGQKTVEQQTQMLSLSRPFSPEQQAMLLASQSKTAAVHPLMAEITAPVSAVTQLQHSASQALPVWQADPLPAQSQHWGQRLVQMLADKVDLQLGLNVNKAMIRLDPPSLGSIELSVQLDGDRLTVQMHSSNTQLREAMGQGLEQLRASLQQKLGADVQIELRMGSDSSSQQQQQKTPLQGALQPEANFHAEPEMTTAEAAQVNRLNLVNQLV